MPLKMFSSLVNEIVSVISSARAESYAEFPAIPPPVFDLKEKNCIVETVLVHETCGLECFCGLVVEVWTFQLTNVLEDFDVSPVDLKKAICCFLPRSQLSNWLTDPGACSCIPMYRRSHSGSLSTLRNSTQHVYEFPNCVLDTECAISIKVEYLKAESLPTLPSFCLPINDPIGSRARMLHAVSPVDRLFKDTLSLKHKVLTLDNEGPIAKQLRLDESVPRSDASSSSSNLVEELANSLKESLGSRARQRTRSSIVKSRFLNSSPVPPNKHSDITLRGAMKGVKSSQSLSLLGNFEESALKGRLEPIKSLEGFSMQITATGSFCSPSTSLPVRVFVFDSNDFESLPCLGVVSLSSLGTKGYNIPRIGTVQVTLSNPDDVVLRTFITNFDVDDMPPLSQTFIRQRYSLRKLDGKEKKLLHLLHLRLATDKKGKLYIHSDIRILFTQNNFLNGSSSDIQGDVVLNNGLYKVHNETEFPCQPRYSPKKS